MKIGYCYPDSSNPFWQAVVEGFKEEARERDVGLVLKASGNDEDQQVSDLYTFAEKGVDIICVSPVNTDKAIDAVAKLSPKGLRFIAVDQNMGRWPEVTILSNNHIGGLKLGNFMANSLPDGAKLLHLSAGEGIDNARTRREAFIEGIESASKNITILETLDARSSMRRARQQVLSYIENNGHVDGVFAENDAMALGAILAYRMHKIPLPAIVGYDGIDDAKNAIRSGEMLATVEQFPIEIGKTSLAAAHDIANGETLMKTKFVRTELLSCANLKSLSKEESLESTL